MSKEYIEKESILKEFEKNLKYQNKNGYWQAAKQTKLTIEKITEFPTADVEPVRHGRWLDMGVFDAHHQPIFQCSECRKEVADYYINKHMFCLHCGAKMDKE